MRYLKSSLLVELFLNGRRTGEDEEQQNSLSKYSTLNKYVVHILLGSFCLNALSMALPLSLLQVYDRIIPNASFGTLVLLVSGVMLALVLETILRIARGNIISWTGTKFEHQVGCAAFERILHAKGLESKKEGVGDTLERMTSIRTSREYYGGQLIASLIDIPFVFIFLWMIYLLGGSIVIVPLIVLCLFGVVPFFYGKKLGKAIRHYNVLRDRRLNFLIEVMRGIHSVKAMGMEAQMDQRHSRLQDSIAEADQDMVLVDTANQHLSFIFAQITMIGVAAYGSLFVVSHEITIGVLAACTLLSGRALQPFQRLTGLWSRLQNILIAREKLKGIFDLSVREDVEDAEIRIDKGAIKFDNMTFAYRDGAPMFEKLSLDVAAGECIGITGGNGVGKSTLLNLLKGDLEPTVGEISIDGIPLTQYSHLALKGSGIAFLPQNGAIFNGTIIENLTMFDRSYRKRALDMAEGLGLNEVVAKMSKGYETIVGNSGSESLPRGIRQRIAIARALVRNPKIILFDEANASIDGPGDVFLRDYLLELKGNATLVLVTPRPSMLRIADRVFELSDGTLKPKKMGSPQVVSDKKTKQESKDKPVQETKGLAS